jgi:heptosyltransferase-2
MILSNISNIKFLILRLSSIGDIILTSHLLRNLKNKFSNSEIHYITLNNYSILLENNPHISKLISYDKSWSKSALSSFISSLKKENSYDVIIDLQGNSRSREITSELSEKKIIIDKRRLYKLALVHLKKNIYNNILSIPEIYFNSIKELNIIDDNKGLEFWFPEEKRTIIYTPEKRIYISKQIYKIAIAPGAHFKTKRWLPEYFVDTAKILKNIFNCEFNVIGGKDDFEICEYISKEINAENYSGKTSIIETARLIDKADLLITNDTGVMHIAAARKTPAVVIFGSTVKDFGFAPFRSPHVVIEKDIFCRPCSHIGRNFCPLWHFNCMKSVTPQFAVEKIVDLLKIYK